jgi:hypothetical protein
MGKKMNAYSILEGKTRRKEPLGKSRCRCEDNGLMDIREAGRVYVALIHVAQSTYQSRTFVTTIMTLWIP